MQGHTRRRGKTWSFVIDLGPDANGKRRQKWVSGFKTKAEASKALRNHLHLVDVGGDPFPEEIVFGTFVRERWLPHLRANGKQRPATIDRYEALLERWALPRIGRMKVTRIGPRHIQATLDAVTAAGKAPRTVQRVRSAISGAFAWAIRQQIVTVNPVQATETPTAREPELMVPTTRQVHQLVDGAKEGRWAIATAIAAYTGLRRSEVLGLTWLQIDFDRARLHVVARLGVEPDGTLALGEPKTPSSRRTVPMPATLVTVLRAHRAEQRRRRLAFGKGWHDLDLVCERGDGSPCSPDAFTRWFLRHAERQGLAGTRLHDLRHAYATRLAEAGASALITSRLLGHSSVSFTQSAYQHVDEALIDMAAEQVEAALA